MAKYEITYPIERFEEYLTEINDVLMLSLSGIQTLKIMPSQLQVLVKSRPERFSLSNLLLEDDSDKLVNFLLDLHIEFDPFSKLNKSNLEDGRPILISHSLVSAWGALEVAILDLSVYWLLNVRETLSNEKFSKVKISLVEYELLDEIDRMRYIINEFENQNRINNKLGIGRFEALLEEIGLGGQVDKSISETLFKYSQIRHLIVHRGGIVDVKFQKNCKHLGFELNEKIVLKMEDWEIFKQACQHYIKIIVERIEVSMNKKLEIIQIEHGKKVDAD